MSRRRKSNLWPDHMSRETFAPRLDVEPAPITQAATSQPRREPRGPSRFTQADVARAIRAAKKENLSIAAVRIEPDGTILIVPGRPQSVPDLETSEWDE
jgi:hypothetical protein